MSRNQNTSVRFRLLMLLITALTANILILIFSWYFSLRFRVSGPISQDSEAARKLLADSQPTSLYISEAYILISEMELATDQSFVRKEIEKLKDYEAAYTEARNYWLQAIPDSPKREIIKKELHEPAKEFFRLAREEYVPLVLKGGEDRAKATTLFREKMRPEFVAHRVAVDEMVRQATATAEELKENAADNSTNWLIAMAIVNAAVIIAILYAGMVTTRRIVQPITQLINAVNTMARGDADLTARVEVKSNDEIGQLGTAINDLIMKIQGIVVSIRESCVKLLSTSSQINSTAKKQESTVHQLGSSTTQIAAAVREISATSIDLSGTMDDVSDRANHAAMLANTGRNQLGTMERTMHQLVDSTSTISSKLSLIREKADNINVVVTTITKVADQTNLLSINAAIEAEKAGDYGRGFLVVAREIRRLADQTAVATLDIENIVRHMQDAVSAGVMQMDQFSDEVQSGVGKVGQINQQTTEIIDEVRVLSERFKTITEGMKNQTIGAQQISEAMVTVSGGAKDTSHSLVQFQQSTEELRHAIEMLNQEIGQFKV
ncbi:MAG: methyl-accepting chemotaxis protein [Zavarzinella sp.]